MINAVVAGAGGRMGARIIQMIQNTQEIKLYGAFERPDHPAIGQDVGAVAHLGNLGLELKGDITETIEGADVVIDFTEPESTLRNIRLVAAKGQAMVIGTTGITGEMHKELYRLAQGIRCVMSPNMSVGLNPRCIQNSGQRL